MVPARQTPGTVTLFSCRVFARQTLKVRLRFSRPQNIPPCGANAPRGAMRYTVYELCLLRFRTCLQKLERDIFYIVTVPSVQTTVTPLPMPVVSAETSAFHCACVPP